MNPQNPEGTVQIKDLHKSFAGNEVLRGSISK